jgi:tRNA C32,U32 (ribose-2'-O)-methylase TrmJ
MYGKNSSMNVVQATSIALYQITASNNYNPTKTTANKSKSLDF